MTRWLRFIRWRVRKATWTPRKRRSIRTFTSHWWVSTWVVLTLFALASGFMAGTDITFEPGLVALCVAMVLIRDTVKSGRSLSLVLALLGVSGGYLAFAQGSKTSAIEINFVWIVGLLILVSALYGLVVAIIAYLCRR